MAIPAEIRDAVIDLSSEEFSRRQMSEQRLLEMGPAAYQPLVSSLDDVPMEAGQRILTVLEQIWLRTPEPESDALERQLETLRLTPGPYQPDVARLLFAHHQLRESRAVKVLRRLNAIVETTVDENAYELQIRLGQIPETIPMRISQIILPRTWKGTDADLWHIQRLAHLKYLSVFVIQGNGVSDSARQQLEIGFPDLMVLERAEVFLGVISSQIALDNRIGCRVTDIQYDSPAQYAGLEPGDLIESVDGVPIDNFNGLVDELKTKRGYQPVELKVERFGKQEPLLVTVICLPWEVRQFPSPPPPPMAETLFPEREHLYDLPLPSDLPQR